LRSLFFYIILLTAFNAFSQSKPFATELSSEFRMINDLILVDTKKAKQLIDSLEKKYTSSGNHAKLEELSLNAIEYYRSIGDFPHMEHQLYTTMANTRQNASLRVKLGIDYYRAINLGYEGNEKKMLSILENTLEQARKNNYYFLEAQCLAAYGKFYLNKNQFAKGQQYLKKSEDLFLKIKEYHSNAAVKMTRGIGYFWEGNNEKAFEQFHQGLAYCKKFKLQKSYCQSLTNVAEAHLFAGNLDSSKIYYDEFLKMKDQSDIRDLYQVYWGLEYYFKEIKNIDSAYHYATLKTTIDDSIRGIMDEELGNDIELKYYEDLNKKVLDQKDRAFRNQQKLNFVQWIIFLVIGIVLVILLLLVINSNRKKNKLNSILLKQKEAIALKNTIIDGALKEKELLLKEIHHRVKNNLQVISSLLNLQAKNITDKHAIEVLEEGKERIQAIALIHHRLYQSEDFAYIAMEDYLPDLIHQLKRTYVSPNCHIESFIQTNNIKLSLDAAVPLGLIICELITNSFKHAFAGRDHGTITISLNPDVEPKTFVLVVKDDGTGIPDGIDFPAEGSLGAEIIVALTEQLSGELKIESSENGSSFTLKFMDSQSIV